MQRLVPTVSLLVGLVATAHPAAAQPIATLRWQLNPYCNVVTLTISQSGSIYRLDGTDDQCGAATKASVAGVAYINPDTTIGFGFAIVGSPGAAPAHISANVTFPSLNGTWRDSGGNSGTFVLTPGAGIGGSPRTGATREVSVPAFEAMVAGGSTSLAPGGCTALSSSSSTFLFAGLSLPVGAVITEIQVKLTDLSSAAMTARLFSDNHPDGGARITAAESDPLLSTDGVRVVALSLNPNASVPVSSTRTYHLEVTTTGPYTGELSYCGAVVRYRTES